MASPEPLIGAVAIDYRGDRYVLGRTSDAYAIWDPALGGPPRRVFPLTVEGWAEAWREYRDLEATAGPTESEERVIPQMVVGQVMAAAFVLYRRHFRVLVVIAGAVILPFSAVSLALILATVRLVERRVGVERVITPEVPGWVDALNNVLLYAFVVPFLTGAIVTAAAWALLGRKPTVAGAFRRALERAPSVVWVSVLAGLAVAAPLVPGLIAAVGRGPSPATAGVSVVLIAVGLVPAVFLAMRFLFGTSVVVLEGIRGIDALRRSWNLVRGLTGKVLGALLLAFLILFAILFLLLVVVLTLVVFRDLTGTVVLVVLVAVSAMTAITITVVGPYINLVIVMLYLDARGRKEKLTLEGLAGEVDAGA